MLSDQFRAISPELEDETIHQLIATSQTRIIPRNTDVDQAGKPISQLMFCLTGVLAIMHSTEDKEVVKQFIVDGEFVPSIIGLLDQQPTLTYLKAIEETTLLIWDGEEIRELAANNKALLSFLNHIVYSNYSFKERRETFLLAYSPIQYYVYLVKNCPFISKKRISLRYIASYIGVAPETLSRIRGRKAYKY